MPQRGDKKALLETVEKNAQQAFALHKTRRASDLTARSKALSEIQEALELDEAPLRIECFDVSHVQGTNVVASMVVFEDGLARKSEYRRFAVRGHDGVDDTASMREVVRRRFARYLDERSRRPTCRPTRPTRTCGGGAGGPRPLGRASRRRPGRPDGRGGSPTRRSSWSSTAASRRSPRRRRRSTSWASPTSRCAGWPSASRRSGCPGRTTR